MRGYLNKDSNLGSIWVGITLLPMQKFKDNFMILSTDYDTYAIITTCTPKTVMYDQDEITILVRDKPENVGKELEEKVREEF